MYNFEMLRSSYEKWAVCWNKVALVSSDYFNDCLKDSGINYKTFTEGICINNYKEMFAECDSFNSMTFEIRQALIYIPEVERSNIERITRQLIAFESDYIRFCEKIFKYAEDPYRNPITFNEIYIEYINTPEFGRMLDLKSDLYYSIPIAIMERDENQNKNKFERNIPTNSLNPPSGKFMKTCDHCGKTFFTDRKVVKYCINNGGACYNAAKTKRARDKKTLAEIHDTIPRPQKHW